MANRMGAVEVSKLHFVQPSKYNLDKYYLILKNRLATIGGNSFLSLFIEMLFPKLRKKLPSFYDIKLIKHV